MSQSSGAQRSEDRKEGADVEGHEPIGSDACAVVPAGIPPRTRFSVSEVCISTLFRRSGKNNTHLTGPVENIVDQPAADQLGIAGTVTDLSLDDAPIALSTADGIGGGTTDAQMGDASGADAARATEADADGGGDAEKYSGEELVAQLTAEQLLEEWSILDDKVKAALVREAEEDRARFRKDLNVLHQAPTRCTDML